MTAPATDAQHQLECITCDHEIRPYGFHAWRCTTDNCTVSHAMIGCIPQRTPPPEAVLTGDATPRG